MENKKNIIKVNKNTRYAVFKLMQSITYTDPFTGKEKEEKILGIDGFLPCYKNIREAEEAACDGKYDIILIQKKDK